MWEMPKFAPDKHFPLRGICRISSAYHSFSRLVASCTNLFFVVCGERRMPDLAARHPPQNKLI